MTSSDADEPFRSSILSTYVPKCQRKNRSWSPIQSYYNRLKKQKQATTYSKLDPKNDFYKEYASAESVLSVLKPNWHAQKAEDRFSSATDLMPPLSRGISLHSHQTIEMGDEEEVQLPRTFMTYGIDWDSELDEANYGTDVVVVSESESDDESSRASHINAGSRPSAGIFSSPGVLPPSWETATRNDEHKDGSENLSANVTHGSERSRTDVVRDIDSQDLNSQFLSQLAKLTHRRASTKQLQKLYYEKLLNVEARKKAPKKVQGQEWRSHDPEALELMRQSTVTHVRSPSANSGRKSFITKTPSPEGDLESLRSGKLFVKRITRELGSTDLRKHIVITVEDMNDFCVKNPNKTIDLVLQGKEVFKKLGRRVQDFDLPYIFSYLIVNREVISLDLSYNEITKTGAWYIMDFLSWNTTLKSLNLMNNDIDGLDSHMIDAICQNQTLKSLRLNGNPLGKQEGGQLSIETVANPEKMSMKEEVVDFLREKDPGVVTPNKQHSYEDEDFTKPAEEPSFILTSIRFTPMHHRQGGEYIAFLLMFKELELLDIGQTDQTIQSLAWISQALMQVESLKVLDLSRILGYPGYVSDSLHFALAFSDILRFCSSLVELHLQKNNLTDVDLEQLLFGFSFNKTLELLDLGCNHISDVGAELIANALQCGAPLKALMLTTNRIGNPGARALSLKLPFSQIKLLDLADNHIGDQGIIDLVQTIEKPHPMMALFIFGNHLTTRSLEVIQVQFSNGLLSTETLDINLYYIDGVIGHGRNTATNRYRARYYRVENEGRCKTLRSCKRRPSNVVPCTKPGCLKYEYHNLVNVRNKFSKTNHHSILGPACPV